MKRTSIAQNVEADLPREILDATVKACRARYARYPNMIDVGSGLKFRGGQHIGSTCCVHFYVRSKLRTLPSGIRLPRFVYARTPEGEIDYSRRVPTDVVELRDLRFAQKSGTEVFVIGESGTITMVFANLAEPASPQYLLTCAHVVGDLRQSPPVDPTIRDQSGVLLAATIANATEVHGAVSYDIALARLLGGCAPGTALGIVGTQQKLACFMPSSQIRPGLQVDCAFPVSNVQTATVASHRTTLPLVLDGRECSVRNLFLINRAPRLGDSGGLIYSDGAAVGILVGMSNCFGLFHPLEEAFDYLQQVSSIPIQCF